VLNNHFTSGGVIAMLQLSTMLMSSVAGLAMLNIQIQEAKVALERMSEYTQLNDENNDSNKTSPFDITKIELKNLDFGFPGRSKILKNISTVVEKGECLGIIGEIGSGKSTLLQVIQKFYVSYSGSIIVNESFNLDKINTNTWRNHIGVVSQNPHLFTGNIFYNITLEMDYDSKNVIDFCEKFGFDKFINILPQSYHTIIGEEGVNLSGGQRQIIAFARCLYKFPQLILLDEVTSSLDSETENFIIDILKEIKKEVLIIFASHNLQTLNKIADKTLSIKNPRHS
jgi:ATP-binding cassette subfamily B protein